MPLSQIYTLSEVSELLKVSERTAKNWIVSGKLDGFKLGGQWRVTEEALQDIITNGLKETNAKGESDAKE